MGLRLQKMRHINHDLVNVCSKLKLFVCCFVWFCSTTSQSQHVVEESNIAKKDHEKSVITPKNQRTSGNNSQRISTNHQNPPDANQCAIKLDELNASVMRLKQRRLMLLEKGENSRNIIQAINFEITQKELEIAYWNSMLISIKAAEQQKVPKPIYDGTLAGDEHRREALKAKYYEGRQDNPQKITFSRTDLESLPQYKQEAIVRDTLHYRIVK
jgi:hypothetical protein